MAAVRLGVAHRLIAGLGVLALLTVLAVGVAVYGAGEFRRGFDHIALTRLGHLVSFAKLAQQSQIVAASAPRLVASTDGFELDRQVNHTRDLFLLLDAAFAELEASGASPAAVEALAGYRPAMEESLRRLAELVAERHAAERALHDGVGVLVTTAEDLRKVAARVSEVLTSQTDLDGLPYAMTQLDALRLVTDNLNRAIDGMLPVSVVTVPAVLSGLEHRTATLLDQARTALQELSPALAHSLAGVLDSVAAQTRGEDSVFALRRRQLAIAARTQGLLARNNVVAGQFVSTVSRLFGDLQSDIVEERRDFGAFVATAHNGLLAIGGVAILAALLVVWYVRSHLLARLLDLQQCMAANARGEPVPVPAEGRDEIAQMGHAFRHFVDAVASREAALAAKSQALEQALASVAEGTRYARRIQLSLLPRPDAHGGLLDDVAVVWQPLDVVGGDCYWIGRVDGRCVVALMDCTGHGVPGAVMTAIATSALTRILQDDQPLDPAEMLARMDGMVRTALRQDTAAGAGPSDDAEASNDGLDAAICIIDPTAGTLSFAGANLPLLYQVDGEVHTIRGTRASLGYRGDRRSGPRFRRHDLALRDGFRFYLYTDGIIDHVGGERRMLFGRRRLQEVLQDAVDLPADRVAARVLAALDAYRGDEPRRDDMTFIAAVPHLGVAEVRAASDLARAH